MLGPADSVHPVLRVVFDREREGSRPGSRSDEHLVCLAIEGGGLRGAVSAGMCQVLEATGLVASFDRIYGVSAGAFNGACLAAGRAGQADEVYRDAASPRCINRWRALARRPVVDLDYLFDELIGERGLLAGHKPGRPDFRALATSCETRALRVLGGFADAAELTQAVRASASLPALCGQPAAFRGEAMVDGALIEAIPFRTPLREDATHVLVLRSRPPGFRVGRHWGPIQHAALRDRPELAALARRQPGAYNRGAELLEHPLHAVLQVAVDDEAPLIGRLEADPRRIDAALAAGAAAMAAALVTENRSSQRGQSRRSGLACPAFAPTLAQPRSNGLAHLA
jgi:predicted patatin/cPLA2 family phospholipase